MVPKKLFSVCQKKKKIVFLVGFSICVLRTLGKTLGTIVSVSLSLNCLHRLMFLPLPLMDPLVPFTKVSPFFLPPYFPLICWIMSQLVFYACWHLPFCLEKMKLILIPWWYKLISVSSIIASVNTKYISDFVRISTELLET